MEKLKLLLVEDEAVLAMVLKETLEARDFEVEVAVNGVEGWSKYRQFQPDICVLDIMLPRKDGLALLSDIRLVDDHTAIVLLTAKIQSSDVLKGLELGADDYVKKPFSMEELMLRIKNLVRRRRIAAEKTPSASDEFSIGRYQFNHARQELTYRSNTIVLSAREADLLKLLTIRKNHLLDKRSTLIQLWGEDNFFNSRSMDVYITRLRKSLARDSRIEIINIRGKGYKLID